MRYAGGRRWWVGAILWLAACEVSVGPSAEEVQKAAATMFQQAARGEKVPIPIPFTGLGPAAPKLLSSHITTRRQLASRGGEFFEYEVRLEYLNRIQQMESATVTVRFEQRGGRWEPVQ